MNDVRVKAILSLIPRTSDSADCTVTEDTIREYVNKNPFAIDASNEIIAKLVVADVKACAAAAAVADAAFQRGLQSSRNPVPPPNTSVLPPAIAPTTASSLEVTSDQGRKKKAKYESEILPKELYENSFIHVKNYCVFVEGCAAAVENQKQPTIEATACFGNNSFAMWCPIENDTGLKETKRSLALCRAFTKELHEERLIDVQHQTPVSPTTSKSKQDADLCFFVQHPTVGDGGEVVLAELEYKPLSTFDVYDAQASAYGTDLMHMSKFPLIIIQAHGATLDQMQFRAFGIVLPTMTNETQGQIESCVARHRRALLFEGLGASAFAAIAQGLCNCAANMTGNDSLEQLTPQGKVSAVASVHQQGTSGMTFYKSYDYRLRSTQKNNRRHANIHLVRKFIDPQAVYFKLGEDLEVIKTFFFSVEKNERLWYHAFPAANLALILSALFTLHKMGYVHGDIRLFNFLLHVGKLVDFDHARQAGTFYPDTIQSLAVDGKRAQAVDNAITGDTLSKLQMHASHDLEAMASAVKRLRPHQTSPQEFKEWWKVTIATIDTQSLSKMKADISERFAGNNHLLEFDDGLQVYLGDGKELVLCVTGSPNKAQQGE